MKFKVKNITGHSVYDSVTRRKTNITHETPNIKSGKLVDSIGVCVDHAARNVEKYGYVFEQVRFYNQLWFSQQQDDWGVDQSYLPNEQDGPHRITETFVLQGSHRQNTDRVKATNKNGDDIYDPASYTDYAAAVVKAIKNRSEFTRFEIMNEPNGFWKNDGYYPPEAFAALMSTTYDAVQKAGLDVEIVMGGMYTIINRDEYSQHEKVDVGLDWFQRFVTWCNRNRGYFNLPFDVFSFHIYFRLGKDPHTSPACRMPDFDHLDEFKRNLRVIKSWLDRAAKQRNIEKIPIFVGETGYNSVPTNIAYAEDRLLWLLESTFMMLELGVDKVFWYRFQDDSGDIWQSKMGLVTQDGTQKNDFKEIAVILDQLKEYKLIEYNQEENAAAFQNDYGKLAVLKLDTREIFWD